MTSQMEARAYGIGQLLTERGLFRVPAHQRDFAWTDDVVEQYVDDILRALQENADDYFVGLIVLVPPDKGRGPFEILDGQQRLATTTMLYATIRQWLSGAGFDKDAGTIQASYIGLSQLGQRQDTPRLALNTTNRDLFREFVIKNSLDESIELEKQKYGRLNTNRKLLDALMKCREMVWKYAQHEVTDRDLQASRLYKFAEYIKHSVKVVCLDVSSAANAFVIFESLNDRGLELSILDLIKNNILSRADEDVDEVQTAWAQMTGFLGDRSADDFIKVFWTSRFGRIRRGTLFEEWKDKFSNRSDAIGVAHSLVLASENYASLENPASDVWEPYGEKVRSYVDGLSLLSSKPLHPIIMSALEKFENSEFGRLMELLLVLTVRYQVSSGRTGDMETKAARTAREIWNGTLPNAMSVWTDLKALIPSDESFRQAFTSFVETRPQRAKYILKELESVAYQRKHGRHRDSIPESTLTLEHVLPRNPSAEWNSVLSADEQKDSELYNRLGNLCLVRSRQNQRIANKPFDFKCANLYSASELVLTKSIFEDYTVWNRAAIDDRQSKLAKLATISWPLPKEATDSQ
jgi:uncharacterized protein DUF262/uncharacterized protein DUF1524